jgi:hypothetical protein
MDDDPQELDNESDIGQDVKMIPYQDTGKSEYPFDLSESQVARLIFFFGARKGETAVMGRDKPFTDFDKEFLTDAFGWFNLTIQAREDIRKAYNIVTLNFKKILDFLKKRPAYVTRDIYLACKAGNYATVTSVIAFVTDEHGNFIPKMTGGSHRRSINVVPLGKMEAVLWNIQNMAVDKMQLILQNITPTDVKRANLGMKSKAFRDIFAAFHMARLQNKSPNQTLVNLQIHTADPADRLRVFSQTVQHNRDN